MLTISAARTPADTKSAASATAQAAPTAAQPFSQTLRKNIQAQSNSRADASNAQPPSTNAGADKETQDVSPANAASGSRAAPALQAGETRANHRAKREAAAATATASDTSAAMAAAAAQAQQVLATTTGATAGLATDSDGDTTTGALTSVSTPSADANGPDALEDVGESVSGSTLDAGTVALSATPTDAAAPTAASSASFQSALAALSKGGAPSAQAGSSSAATDTSDGRPASTSASNGPAALRAPNAGIPAKDHAVVAATDTTSTKSSDQTLASGATDVARSNAPQQQAADASNTALSVTQAAVAATASASAPALMPNPAASAANAIAAPVGTPEWEDGLSQKVVFLSNAHQQSAELTLNPKDLGPLQVVLQVADNHAHALFVSQHQQVREAVEAALPKLREALQSGGLGLGSASVSDGFAGQTRQQGQGSTGGGRSRASNGGTSNVADITSAPSIPMRQSVGLVDTFA